MGGWTELTCHHFTIYRNTESLHCTAETNIMFYVNYCAKMGTVKDRNGKDLTEAKRVRKSGKNTQKNYTRKVVRTQITTMVRSLTQSQTSWSVKSRGPQEASPRTKLVEVTEPQRSDFRS